MSLSEESEPVEAETIAFQQSPADEATIAFGQGPEAGASGLDGDATLVAPPSAGLGMDLSADATLDMGKVAVPAPASPSQSGAMRAAGAKRERASTQDLAAVKELLGSSTASPPRPGSASIPSQRWEPVLSSQSRPGRDHGTLGETLRSPILKSIIAIVLLAVVVVGGWIAYTAQNRPASRPVTTIPGPTPLPSVAQASGAPSPAIPLGSATPAAPASPAATAQALPAPTVAAAKPVITPIPATPPSPKAVDKPTPTPTPTPAPRTTPVATPAPAPAKPTPAARPAGGGYEALKAGRLAEAGAAFEAMAQSRGGEFSVQLLVACSPQTVEKAVQNDPSTELFILPATIGGKPCHRLMRGFFKTGAEATQAVASLPPYYVAEGAKPKAVPMKSVLR
jgi:septal ring-binding cell division protein DamX